MFSAQISRTVKGDAISEIAKSILRTKVLSLLEANKTNKEFLVDTRNAISFILHNQNLKIRNLNLLDSDKINRLSSVLFTPNFIMDGAIDTITSVAKSISEK